MKAGTEHEHSKAPDKKLIFTGNSTYGPMTKDSKNRLLYIEAYTNIL